MSGSLNNESGWLKAILGAMPDSEPLSPLASLATQIPKPAVPIPSSGSRALFESLSTVPTTPHYGALAALARSIQLPGTPSCFTKRYLQNVIDRSNRRIDVLADRLEDIPLGRVMPDRDDITIGSAKRFNLAILFLDICGFSSRPNWLEEDQKKVLAVMNIFMAEMLSIVHDFDGTYEKNTGDGLMAYFGEDSASVEEAVKPAAEAALIMHYVNDYLLTPWFAQRNIPQVLFRVGIDFGPVMIARVGIHGEKSSRVAVGTAANIANKLMNRIRNGGVCIGDEVRKALPHNWSTTCKQCAENSGFVYVRDGSPYTAWELNHRLSRPIV